MSKKEISKKISRYIRGKLTRQEADELWEEFLRNPEYYELFEAELHLHELGIRQSSSERDFPGSVKNKLVFYLRKEILLPVAAVLVFCFGIIAYTISQQNGTLASVALGQIEVNEILGSELQRSGNNSAVNIDVEINRGVAAAYQMNYEEAIAIFKNLIEQNIDPPLKNRIMFNLGILSYNQKIFDEATDYFEKVDIVHLGSANLTEKLLWFKANSYLQVQDAENSVQTLDSLIQLNGSLSPDARSLKLTIQNLLTDPEN